MASRLFIGNLSFNVADAQLNELFAELNIQIENIRLMRDQTTGRSRGFAFAELAPGVDMAAAITQLNGKVLDGRPLTVNEARPQAQREFRPRGAGSGGGGHRKPGGGFGGNRRGSGGRGQERPKRERRDDLY